MKKIKSAMMVFLAVLLCLPLIAGAGTEAKIKLEQAKVKFSDNDFAGAAKLLDEVIAEEPDNAEAHQYAGLCQMAQGKAAEAIPYFEKAAALKPQSAGALADLAWAQYESDNYEAALDSASKALVISPDSPRALYYKGLALLSLERYGEALIAFQSLAVKSEDYKQAGFYYAGVCLVKEGKTEEAVTWFKQAVDAGPDTALGQEAAKFVKVLEGGGQAPAEKAPYGLKFRLLYQYDTNIVPVNDDDYLPEEISDKEDGRVVVDLDAYYNFVNTDAGKAQVRYVGYASFHGQEESVNLMYHLGELSGYADFPMGAGKFRLTAAGNYSTASLDSDPYSNGWKGTLGAGFHWNGSLLTRIIGEYLGETFDEPGEGEMNRDNTAWQATIYQHFFLLDGKLNTWVGYRYGQVMAEGDNYNRTDNAYLAGLAAALPNNSFLYLIYRYEDRDYPDNSFDREERRNVASLAFQTPIYKALNFYASAIYTNVDANLELLEYERWVYGGGLLVEL